MEGQVSGREERSRGCGLASVCGAVLGGAGSEAVIWDLPLPDMPFTGPVA